MVLALFKSHMQFLMSFNKYIAHTHIGWRAMQLHVFISNFLQ